MAVLDKPLSNLQIELLQLYSQNVSEEDLVVIKRLLARYFANRASDAMDELWEQEAWTNETMDEWLSDEDEVQAEIQ